MSIWIYEIKQRDLNSIPVEDWQTALDRSRKGVGALLALDNTGLFERVQMGCRRLKGTDFFVSIYWGGKDFLYRWNRGTCRETFSETMSFESVLEEVDAEVRISLLFHLELFV